MTPQSNSQTALQALSCIFKVFLNGESESRLSASFIMNPEAYSEERDKAKQNISLLIKLL